MRTTPALAFFVVGLTAIGALSAGCGPTTGSSTAPGAAGSPGAAGAPGTAGSAGTAGKGGASTTVSPKATCDQVKTGDVQGLMTNKVTADDVQPAGTDSDGQQCILHDVDSEQAVDILVVPADDQAVGFDVWKRNAKNLVPVPGVGDQAFRETGDLVPNAVHGGLFCSVSISAGDQIPGSAALIKGGSLTFTEQQNAVVATALGTACNRIFGSGSTTPDLSGLQG